MNKEESSQGIVILNFDDDEEGNISFGGLLYELKKAHIYDGIDYQIGNGNELLMYRSSYLKCREIIERFGIEPFEIGI